MMFKVYAESTSGTNTGGPRAIRRRMERVNRTLRTVRGNVTGAGRPRA